MENSEETELDEETVILLRTPEIQALFKGYDEAGNKGLMRTGKQMRWGESVLDGVLISILLGKKTILHMTFFVCFLFWLRINNYFKSQLIDELNWLNCIKWCKWNNGPLDFIISQIFVLIRLESLSRVQLKKWKNIRRAFWVPTESTRLSWGIRVTFAWFTPRGFLSFLIFIFGVLTTSVTCLSWNLTPGPGFSTRFLLSQSWGWTVTVSGCGC